MSDIDLADAVNTVRRAAFADNAGAVNKIKASRTPRQGHLLPLGSGAKFPASVLPASAPRGPRGPEGPAGPAGAAGPAGPRGPSEARVVTPASRQISTQDNVYVTVASMTSVAAGSYLVAFTAVVDYRVDTHRMYVTCEVRVNGVGIGSTRGIVGEVAGSTGALALSVLLPHTRSTPYDLSAACVPSSNALSGQPAPTVERIRLAAIRLDSVAVG